MVLAKFFPTGTSFATNAQLESATPLIDHFHVLGYGDTPPAFTVDPGEYALCASVGKVVQVNRGDFEIPKLDMTAKPWCRALAVPTSGTAIEVAVPANTQ